MPNPNADAGDGAETTPTGTDSTANQPNIEKLQAQLKQFTQQIEDKDNTIVDLQNKLSEITTEATEYKKRFTGSQGSYQREQSKWKEAIEKNDEMTATIKSLSEQVEQLTGNLATITEERDVAVSEAEIANLGLERTKIIIEEFPGFLTLEADGLLPDGSGDEFRNTLKKFAARMEKLGVDNIIGELSGSSPAPPEGEGDKTRDALFGDLKGLLRGQADLTMEEYDQAYDKMLQSMSKE